MAQNEIQKYTVNQTLYDNVRNPLNTLYENHNRLERLSNFLNSAGASDYPDIPTATLTDMGNLRTQINTYLAAQTTIDMIDEIKTFIQI